MGFWCFCCDRSPYIHGERFFDNSYNLIQNGINRARVDTLGSDLPGGTYGDGFESQEEWKSVRHPFAIRADGTLWCFSTSFSYYWRAAGLYGRPYRPIQVGSDSDWKELVVVGDDSFFLLKNDGTLWGIGNKGKWGQGYYEDGSQITVGQFRARISSSIKSCFIHGGNHPLFSRKPSARLARFRCSSISAINSAGMEFIDMRGSGAVLEASWKGAFPAVYVPPSIETGSPGYIAGEAIVDAQGSGYTSVPTVSVIPPEGSSLSDEELSSVSVSVTSMTKSLVESFEVVSGGQGYTTATAVEQKTGATAVADIAENGVIAGWTVTSHGNTPALNPFIQGSVEVFGDGSGGEARAVAYPSGILKVHAIENPEIWDSPPTLQITGGGGTGAEASVPRVQARVSGINILSSGAGYTQTNPRAANVGSLGDGEWLGVVLDPDPADDLNDPLWRLGDGRDAVRFLVDLTPSGVVGLEGNESEGKSLASGEVVAYGSLASDGTLEPSVIFTPPASPRGSGDTIHSIQSRNPATGEIVYWQDTSFDGNNVWRQPDTITGWPSRPETRVFYKSGPAAPLFYVPYKFNYGSNSGSWTGVAVSYSLSIDMSVVYETAPSVSGAETGGGTEYRVRDGYVEHSRTNYALVSYPFTGEEVVVDEGKIFDGPVAVRDASLNTNWEPPRPESTIDVSLYPDTWGGEVATASAIMTQGSNGVGFRSFTQKTTGAGFTYEPHPEYTINYSHLPERIFAGKTFRSISPNVLVESSGLALVRSPFENSVKPFTETDPSSGAISGLTTGDLYRDRFVPLGQGAFVSCGDSALDSVFVSNRFIIDAPPSGKAAEIYSSSFGYGSPFLMADSASESSGLLPPSIAGFIANSSATLLESGAKTFPVSGIDPRSIYLGWGYVSPPSVRFLSYPGASPPQLSVSLVGPTQFDYVTKDGRVLVGTDGSSYLTRDLNVFDSSTVWARTPYLESQTRTLVERHEPPPEPLVAAFGTRAAVSTSSSVSFVYSFYNKYDWHIDFFQSEDLAGTSDGLTRSTLVVVRTDAGGANGEVVEETPDPIPLSPTPYDYRRVLQISTTTSQRDETLSGGVTWKPGGYPLLDAFSNYSPGNPLESVGVSVDSAGLPSIISESGMISFTASLRDSSPSPMRRIPGQVLQSCVAAVSGATTMQYLRMSDGEVLGIAGLTSQTLNSATTFSDPRFSGFDFFVYGSSSALFRESSAGTLYAAYGNRKNWPSVLANTIVVSSHGSGYSLPPQVVFPQHADVASFDCDFSAAVVGVAVMIPGHGYSSPPLIQSSAETGGGSQFTAVIQGPLYDCLVTQSDDNFKCPPEIVFSQPGISGKAIATLSGYVESVSVASGGSGYAEPPPVSFVGDGDVPATATASISGYVKSVSVLAAGSGYKKSPVISFSGGGGVGAEAVAMLVADADGLYKISKIVVTSPGSGYTSAPQVIATPVDEQGSGFVGSCEISAAVVSIELTNGGSGYSSNPIVQIANTVGVEQPARAVASMRFSLDAIEITEGGEYRSAPAVSVNSRGHVGSLSLVSGGSGYKEEPDIVVVDSCGNAATAVCVVSGGVSAVHVTSGGAGYTKSPLVELQGGYDPVLGSRAKAVASVNAETGEITSIDVTDQGSGYFRPPDIIFVEVEQPTLAVDEVDESGSIVSVAVLSGGYGYAEAPDISVFHSTGIDAEVQATVENGVITSVLVVEGGRGYTKADTSFSASYPQPSEVATTQAEISAAIVSASVTDCGRDYESSHPPKVLINGGGGTGAAITANVSRTGSATATARVNGSILLVSVTDGGSGYEREPVLTVDNSSNVFISESALKLANGEITQQQHDAVVLEHSAVLQAAISGQVQSVTVESPGSGYGTSTDRASERMPIDSAVFYASGVTVSQTGILNGDRGFASVSPPSRSFSAKPIVIASNAYAAEATMSATGGGYSVVSREFKLYSETYSEIPQDVIAVRRWRQFYNGSLTDSRGTEAASVPNCSLGNYSANYAGQGGDQVYVLMTGSVAEIRNDNLPGILPPFSEEPVYTLEDPSGSGCKISLGFEESSDYWRQWIVEESGDNYTLAGRASARGGKWQAWESGAAAEATIDENGRVVSVSVTNQGSGYATNGWYADGITGNFYDGPAVDIYFSGGGGTGAAAEALVNGLTGEIDAITVTNQGSGYVSSPQVVIMDRLPPIQHSAFDFTAEGSHPGGGKFGDNCTPALNHLNFQGIYSSSLSNRVSRSVRSPKEFTCTFYLRTPNFLFSGPWSTGTLREHYRDGHVEWVHFTRGPGLRTAYGVYDAGFSPRVASGEAQVVSVNAYGSGAAVTTTEIRWSSTLGVIDQ